MTMNFKNPMHSVQIIYTVGGLLVTIGGTLPGLYLWYERHHEPSLHATVRPAMIVLPPGTFAMGSHNSNKYRHADEEPQIVQIKTRFAISTTEVTQEHFQSVTGKNPAAFRTELSRPVENVNWITAAKFCNQLSELEKIEPCYRFQGQQVFWPRGVACLGYRLPTEAEWEYAARAHTLNDKSSLLVSSRVSQQSVKKIGNFAWYKENSESTTHPVGMKSSNHWQLFDMLGNVREWVWDVYGPYPHHATDPIGADTGSLRVIRGGSYDQTSNFLRVESRTSQPPATSAPDLGFRIARSYP